MVTVVINCGSSSLKYNIFDNRDWAVIAEGLVEKIGGPEGRIRQRRRYPDGSSDEKSATAPIKDHLAAFMKMHEINRDQPIVTDDTEVFGVGHRVVHGGEIFHGPALIDDAVVEQIRGLSPLAPLHNPANLMGIEAARKRWPLVPQVAVFDTAFHQTLPPHAYRYGIPQDFYEKHAARRYGFHGTSHAYIAREAARRMGRPLSELNLITLHLGNGASACAIQGGRSIDTSMGLTPLEGLVMGTRCGDIDPALHFYLIRESGMSAEDVERLLNSHSGLLGMCGVNDMREILSRMHNGDEQAILAIDVFCYRIKKYIGAYMAALGSVDAIVFSGGIGENASLIRQQACQGLERFGIAIAPAKNMAAAGGVSEIGEDGAPVKVLVIRTDEELEIARQTVQLIEKVRQAQLV